MDLPELSLSALESLPILLAVFDSKGIIRYRNRNWRNHFGSNLAAEGAHWSSPLEGKDEHPFVRRWMDCSSPDASLEEDILLTSPESAQKLWFRASLCRFDRKEIPEASWCVCLVKLRNPAGDELSQQKKLLAILAHELRTPVAAILGWTKILQMKSVDDLSRLKRALDAIEKSANTQAKLIEDALELSRIQLDKLQLNLCATDLAEQTEVAVEIVQAMADDRRISVQLCRLPESLPIRADIYRLRQVLLNLLANALKFSQPGGTIRVTLSRQQEILSLEVADDGAGIPPELLPFVFDCFQNNTQSSGLGLGLFIAKRIVELHGGNIEARSSGPEKGSSFILQFPALVGS